MLLTLYDLIIFHLYPFYLSLSFVLSFLVITLVTAMQQVVLNFAASLPTHARKIPTAYMLPQQQRHHPDACKQDLDRQLAWLDWFHHYQCQ